MVRNTIVAKYNIRDVKTEYMILRNYAYAIRLFSGSLEIHNTCLNTMKDGENIILRTKEIE